MKRQFSHRVLAFSMVAMLSVTQYPATAGASAFTESAMRISNELTGSDEGVSTLGEDSSAAGEGAGEITPGAGSGEVAPGIGGEEGAGEEAGPGADEAMPGAGSEGTAGDVPDEDGFGQKNPADGMEELPGADVPMLLTAGDEPAVVDALDDYITITQDMVPESGYNKLELANGKYKLESDISAHIGITGTDVTLDLNGYALTGKIKRTVITIKSEGTLNLYDSSAEKTGCIKGGAAINYGGGVYVSGNSTFNMYGGTIKENNTGTDTSNHCGDGVYVSGAEFNMYGGAISDNHSDVSTNKNYGGGLYVEGNSTVNLVKGKISNNSSGAGGGIAIVGTSSVKPTVNIGKDVTISDNKTSYYRAYNVGGGGIYVTYANLTIDGATISNNSTGDKQEGGGIYCTFAEIHIKNALMEGNKTTNSTVSRTTARGGAIFIYAKNPGEVSSAVIENTTFKNNSAHAHGGAIAMWEGTELTVKGCEFFGNQAENGSGGAIRTYQNKNKAAITIENTKIHDNFAGYSGGGGLFFEDFGISNIVNMTNSEVCNNTTSTTAKTYGSGVFLYGSAKLSMVNSKINNNSGAVNGGGVQSSNGKLTMDADSEICGNEAKEQGGGVFIIDYSSPELNVNGGTISKNKAGVNAGGVYLSKNALKVTGDAYIYDNTVNEEQNNVLLNTIILVGEEGLTENAKIGVTSPTALTASAPIKAVTDATAEFDPYFVSDQGYRVFRDTDNVIKIGLPDLADATLTAADVTFTGSPVTTTYTITMPDGTVVDLGDKFTCIYGNCINVGTATITITAVNNPNYTGTVSGTFQILPAKVAVPEEDASAFVYNGNEQEYVIPASEAYTVTGNKQTDAGTYTVTVSLNDKANTCWEDDTTEDKTYSFVIRTLGIPVPEADTTAFVYNGTEQEYVIPASEAYTVTGNKQTDAGTYTVTVSLNDKANTCWEEPMTADLISTQDLTDPTEDKTYTFVIASKELTDAMFTASGAEFTYNEDPQGPQFTVQDGELLLVDGEDYEVTDREAIEPGNYQMQIVGKGNYSGTLTFDYVINALPEETTEPTEETTEPTEETTAPVEETTVPTEESTASAEETTAAPATTAPAQTQTPNTADPAPIALYSVLLLISAFCLTGFRRRYGHR